MALAQGRTPRRSPAPVQRRQGGRTHTQGTCKTRALRGYCTRGPTLRSIESHTSHKSQYHTRTHKHTHTHVRTPLKFQRWTCTHNRHNTAMVPDNPHHGAAGAAVWWLPLSTRHQSRDCDHPRAQLSYGRRVCERGILHSLRDAILAILLRHDMCRGPACTLQVNSGGLGRSAPRGQRRRPGTISCR